VADTNRTSELGVAARPERTSGPWSEGCDPNGGDRSNVSAVTRNEFDSLPELLAEVAKRKHDAALAHRSGKSNATEAPRAVYLESCQQIADALIVDGFKYAKSKQTLSRARAGFTNHIAFQSSHNNVAGAYVLLWMFAQVRSPQLKEWRSQQPFPLRKDDFLAGGMVHLLEAKATLLEWQLASPAERPETITDALGFIRSVVIPYFTQFQDSQALLHRLTGDQVLAFSIGDMVEFALCFGSRTQAQSILSRFVAQRPDLADSIKRSVERFGKEGFPEYSVSGYAEVVAWLHLVHRLPLA